MKKPSESESHSGMEGSTIREILSNPYSPTFNPPSYPDRTFRTRILPTNPNSEIEFSEAKSIEDHDGTSASASSEPFRSLSSKISDPTTQASLLQAASSLRQNNLVAFPTETVYGLGGSALSVHSTTSIFKAKKRPMDNPLIVHVSDLNMLDSILPCKEDFDYRKHPVLNALIKNFWPGPMTLLFPVVRVGQGEVQVSKLEKDENQGQEEIKQTKYSIPSTVTCGLSTVAVRMPKNPLARSLISLSGIPIAAPSANASGRPSPTESQHVFKDLGGELDRSLELKSNLETRRSEKGDQELKGRIPYILEGGNCNVGVESTVIDCITDPKEVRILRPGGLSVEEIQEVLEKQDLLLKDRQGESQEKAGKVRIKIFGKDKDSKLEKDQMKNPTTPGMKYRHYAPDSKVIMLINREGQASNDKAKGDEKENGNRNHQVRSGEIVSSLPTILREETLSFLVGTSSVHSSSDRSEENRDQKEEEKRKKKKVIKIGLMCREDSRILSYFKSEMGTLSSAETRESFKSNPEGEAESNGNQNHLLEPIQLELRDLILQDQCSDSSQSQAHQDIRTRILIQIHPFSLGKSLNPEQSAQRIFSGLRRLDEGPLLSCHEEDREHSEIDFHEQSKGQSCDLILVEGQDDEGMGLAVMNRLRKAASQVFKIEV